MAMSERFAEGVQPLGAERRLSTQTRNRAKVALKWWRRHLADLAICLLHSLPFLPRWPAGNTQRPLTAAAWREELLAGLSRELPQVVDKLTPEGRLPTEQEAARMI
jgi:hypothetical protein